MSEKMNQKKIILSQKNLIKKTPQKRLIQDNIKGKINKNLTILALTIINQNYADKNKFKATIHRDKNNQIQDIPVPN